MAIKVIAQRRELKIGNKPGKRFVMRPDRPDGADIYYTLDGSTPTSESTMYTEEFGLSETTTVKSIAILNGVSSEVASKTFTKNA